jgi:DNA-binding MarR family transcriptional regulator/GNAT superfamily N-acetyltransferase
VAHTPTDVDRTEIAAVRSFQRTVTLRAGALQDDFLGRGRPLGACRVLYEIGPSGAEVRSLRSRLGLDSGYLSRVLRGLEDDGLVVTSPSPADGRVRRVELTPHGAAEWSELDRRSDTAAATLLYGLDPATRHRLVAAMGEVEAILAAGPPGPSGPHPEVSFETADPTSKEARDCLARYYAELDERFEGGFDVALAQPTDAEDLVPPRGLMLLARRDGQAIGCGVLKITGDGVADIKRMWLAPEGRGSGVGRRMLAELERRARDDFGLQRVRLETNRALAEALALYRRAGYTEVPPFNDERYGDHWFVKDL